jgi:hypothetical protein
MIFSVVGVLQLIVIVYFLLGYVTTNSGKQDVLEDVKLLKPEGEGDPTAGKGTASRMANNNLPQEENKVPKDNKVVSYMRPDIIPKKTAIATTITTTTPSAVIEDPHQSSYNIKYRGMSSIVESGKYTPSDDWLQQRQEWLNSPLREKPRPPALNWDAVAKSKPKFPSLEKLNSIYETVEMMYIAETQKNLNGEGQNGLFTLMSSTDKQHCLDNLGHGVGEQVGIFSCHGQGGSQAWKFTDGRLCQTAVKKSVCLTIVNQNKGKSNEDPNYVVEFQPKRMLDDSSGIIDAQLWDMKMKTVHGDISIKSRTSLGGNEGLCLVAEEAGFDGSIPVVGVCSCDKANIWSKSMIQNQRRSAVSNVDPDYEEYAFNKPLSMTIGTHREEADKRPPQCSVGESANDEVGLYDPHSEVLPTVSVIIAFVNEEFYTLMRTVWAVLQESPVHLLHEVLIVDDGSDEEM